MASTISSRCASADDHRNPVLDGMKACVRSSDGTCSKLFEVNHGLRQGCVLSQDILPELVHLQEQPRKSRPESLTDCVRRAVWGMLFTDDPCVVSQSLRALAKIMEVIVHVCDAFGLTVSEKKTETICMPAPHMVPVLMHVESGRQRYR